MILLPLPPKYWNYKPAPPHLTRVILNAFAFPSPYPVIYKTCLFTPELQVVFSKMLCIKNLKSPSGLNNEYFSHKIAGQLVFV
jgi:hypothetical protein